MNKVTNCECLYCGKRYYREHSAGLVTIKGKTYSLYGACDCGYIPAYVIHDSERLKALDSLEGK